MEALIKNGITMEDLKAEWHDGYEAGFSEASPCTMKTCYAAFCIALHDVLGFGCQRIAKVLNYADNAIYEHLTTQDIIDKVYQDAGLELNFGDGIEKVQVRDDAKPWRHEKR